MLKEGFMRYSPDYFKKLEKQYPAVAKSFDGLAKACAKAGPLDAKTRHLIKLGVAIGIGSEGDVQNLTMQALADGVSPDEIRHAVLLSVTTAGFPAMIASMQLAEEVIAKKAK
jgi:alkylhydroperoxidase/carboxymuconolactone decarboxylase family protein YurZ